MVSMVIPSGMFFGLWVNTEAIVLFLGKTSRDQMSFATSQNTLHSRCQSSASLSHVEFFVITYN